MRFETLKHFTDKIRQFAADFKTETKQRQLDSDLKAHHAEGVVITRDGGETKVIYLKEEPSTEKSNP